MMDGMDRELVPREGEVWGYGQVAELYPGLEVGVVITIAGMTGTVTAINQDGDDWNVQCTDCHRTSERPVPGTSIPMGERHIVI